MNVSVRDRLCIRNFASQLGFVNVMATLIGFWVVTRLCVIISHLVLEVIITKCVTCLEPISYNLLSLFSFSM